MNTSLNIEAYTNKIFADMPSFRAIPPMVPEVAGGELVCGCYMNTYHNFFVITDMAIHIYDDGLWKAISYANMKNISVPLLESKKWKELGLENPQLRKIIIELDSGKSVVLPVFNDSKFSTWDFLSVLAFVRKILFFENKRRARIAEVSTVKYERIPFGIKVKIVEFDQWYPVIPRHTSLPTSYKLSLETRRYNDDSLSLQLLLQRDKSEQCLEYRISNIPAVQRKKPLVRITIAVDESAKIEVTACDDQTKRVLPVDGPNIRTL